MKDLLTILDSTENFDTWINKNFINNDLRESLRKADILIVPEINFKEDSGITFDRGTEDFLASARNRLPENLTIDICINDDDYLEYSLNSKVIRYSKIIVTVSLLPALGQLIATIISDRLKPEEDPKIEINIKNIEINNQDEKFKDSELPAHMQPASIDITIVSVNKDGSSKTIKIHGKSEDVVRTLYSLKSLDNDGRATSEDSK